MGSFKLRLVIYFMLLALLPLVAATVAFSEVAERGETGSTDSRLSTAIRVAQADYEDQLDEERRRRPARSPARPACSRRSPPAAARPSCAWRRRSSTAAFYSPSHDFLAGERPGPFDGVREVPVKDSDGQLLEASSSTFRSTTGLPGTSARGRRWTAAIASPSSSTGG